MKKSILITAAIFAYSILITANCFSQGTAINTNGAKADSSAMLDVSSTSKGLLVPRMTEAEKQAISNPATGLLIYQTNATTGFWYYNGASWVQAIGPAGPAGATGQTGNNGADGTTGATGNNGIDGATGVTGATGNDGPDGATGATGSGGGSSSLFNWNYTAEPVRPVTLDNITGGWTVPDDSILVITGYRSANDAAPINLYVNNKILTYGFLNQKTGSNNHLGGLEQPIFVNAGQTVKTTYSSNAINGYLTKRNLVRPVTMSGLYSAPFTVPADSILIISNIYQYIITNDISVTINNKEVLFGNINYKLNGDADLAGMPNPLYAKEGDVVKTSDNSSVINGYLRPKTIAGGSSTPNNYYIGQTFGAGGADGVVFYVWNDGQNCLIASPVNNNSGNTKNYSNITSEVPVYNGYDAKSFWDGFHNSAAINNQSTNSAAGVCISYTTPGTSSGTWYLPAKYELDMIYRSQYIISRTYPSGGFIMNYYWSSTEYVNMPWTAHCQFFTDGVQVYNQGKNNTYYVRCIRAL